MEQTKLKVTRIFEDICEAYLSGKRRILLEGGTWSSKTFSALQFLIMLAQQAKDPMLISVVSESLPHLKKGCIKDLFTILNITKDDPRWSKTEFTFNFGKCTMEFFGADEADKVRGPRRDVLFINESNNISWETARGLDVRTVKFTIVDWNPLGSFWAHDNWVGQPENAYSHSTYLDAKAVLPEQAVKNIESNKKDPNWWNVYGLGLLGKVEYLVYPNFEEVDELPEGDIFYGLDFGYSEDPAVLVANVLIGDKLYSKEILYEKSLTNDMIAQRMELQKVSHRSRIWADSSEPKSIEELVRLGWNVLPAVKGRDSVKFGHQKVNQCFQYWTKDSLNCIKEQRNFRYIKKREPGGREYISDETTHQWSHGMDARRYAVGSYIPTLFNPEPAFNY